MPNHVVNVAFLRLENLMEVHSSRPFVDDGVSPLAVPVEVVRVGRFDFVKVAVGSGKDVGYLIDLSPVLRFCVHFCCVLSVEDFVSFGRCCCGW